MSNQVYQTTVQALEAILSPRVVSRSLQEGMRQLGRSPDTVDFAAIEKILKAQIYRQLQVSMPVTQAKETIEGILGRLQSIHGEDGAAGVSPDLGLARQGERLEQLRAALKPYNLYFEWPEVQKLRAQIQLLETEQEAEREAASLADDAEAQLQIVRQKLEDQLVIQARELGELAEALEQVRSLGGPKVRRLENLINQITAAQEGRQLAPAEIDRARRLARDLRKLVESSVYTDEMEQGASHDGAQPAAAGGVDGGVLDVDSEEEDLLSIDTADLAPEVSAKLLLLDLEDERHDLDQLAAEYAGLLEFQPALVQGLETLRTRLDGDASIAEELEALRGTFAEAFEAHRETLTDELQGISASLGDVREEVDTSELRQALSVSLGVLGTTLPSQADIHHVRNLHRLALEQVEALDRAESEARAQRQARLADQAALLERVEATLERYSAHATVEPYGVLQAEVESLRSAREQQILDPGAVERARRAEASLESAIAQLADERVDRQRATLRNLLALVKALPALDTVAARISSVVAEIERQLEGLEHKTLDDAQIEATAGLVDTLKAEVTATLRRRLEALTEQAAELSSPPLLERIRAAMDGLEAGDYPDLGALRASIKQEREAERSDQIGDLHRLERETARFAGMEGASYSALQERLAAARERIDQGLLAPGLAQAWTLLEHLQAEAAQRLHNVFPRLDAALAAFKPVEKLNSDDVASVRRILRHLDSQRGAFERVSIGLQLQLEASLREAETLLDKLREEYEATRVIADQLVSANVLDDVLGFFGDEGAPVGPAPQADPAAAPAEAAELAAAPEPAAPAARAESAAPPEPTEPAEPTPPSATAELAEPAAPPEPTQSAAPDALDVDALLQPYLDEAGVSGAALLAADGAVLGGRLPFGGGPAAELARAWRQAAQRGAATLSLPAARVATLEYDGAAVVAAWPTTGHVLLLTLRSSSAVGPLTSRLRRELDGLAKALSDAHGGPAHP